MEPFLLRASMRSRISKAPPAVIAARSRRDARRLAAEVIRRKAGCARSSEPELSSQQAPLRSIRLSDATRDEIDSTHGCEAYLTSRVAGSAWRPPAANISIRSSTPEERAAMFAQRAAAFAQIGCTFNGLAGASALPGEKTADGSRTAALLGRVLRYLRGLRGRSPE